MAAVTADGQEKADLERLADLWHKRTRESSNSDYPVGPGDVLEISVPAIKDTPRTLEQVVRAVLAMRQELLGAVTQSLVEQEHRQTLMQARALCPKCGRTLVARGPVRRTVETMVGAVALELTFRTP